MKPHFVFFCELSSCQVYHNFWKKSRKLNFVTGYICVLRKSLCLITTRIRRKVVESESTRVNQQKSVRHVGSLWRAVRAS